MASALMQLSAGRVVEPNRMAQPALSGKAVMARPLPTPSVRRQSARMVRQAAKAVASPVKQDAKKGSGAVISAEAAKDL